MELTINLLKLFSQHVPILEQLYKFARGESEKFTHTEKPKREEVTIIRRKSDCREICRYRIAQRRRCWRILRWRPMVRCSASVLPTSPTAASGNTLPRHPPSAKSARPRPCSPRTCAPFSPMTTVPLVLVMMTEMLPI